MDLRPHRFSVDDFHRMDQAGILPPDTRVELVRGQVIVMAPIGSRHAASVDRISHLFIERLGNQVVVRTQGPVQLDDYSQVLPDLAILKRREDFYAGKHPLPEDVLLGVEVGDSSVRYDRNVKAPLYAEKGIKELWLIDLEKDVVFVCREPGPDGYQSVTSVGRGETLQPHASPEPPIPVDAILPT